MLRTSAAVADYQSLRDLMEREEPAVLGFYARGEYGAWHHSRITKPKFVRLAYRVVWTSGFRAETVFAKEPAYFKVLNKTLYRNARHNKNGRGEFLKGVAPILGGSPSNRKNKAVADIVERLEELGWQRFRQLHLSLPACDSEARLLQLPMVGPVTVKLFLNQTGLVDVAKPDLWVTRFAVRHGASQSPEAVIQFVRSLSDAHGDDQTTIDAVLFWAGRTHDLRVPPGSSQR